MTKTMTETKATKAPAIERHGPAVQRHATWSPGDVTEQGDLILVCIGRLPESAKPRVNRQMAEGDTQGARHIVEGGAVWDGDPDAVAKLIARVTNGRVVPQARYIGPIMEGPCVLTHPQHQHDEFPAGTCTAVVYQRNIDAEEREVRALD